MVRTKKEAVRLNKLKKFKPLTVRQKIAFDNMKRNPNLSTTYIRKVRGLVMKGHTIKDAQTKLRS
tara:strand:- start:1140 stop:1334 length:195 start_codon:yes stop_codon:yes gene_type:complete